MNWTRWFAAPYFRVWFLDAKGEAIKIQVSNQGKAQYKSRNIKQCAWHDACPMSLVRHVRAPCNVTGCLRTENHNRTREVKNIFHSKKSRAHTHENKTKTDKVGLMFSKNGHLRKKRRHTAHYTMLTKIRRKQNATEHLKYSQLEKQQRMLSSQFRKSKKPAVSSMLHAQAEKELPFQFLHSVFLIFPVTRHFFFPLNRTCTKARHQS